MIRTILIADDQPICAKVLQAEAQSLDGSLEVEVVDTIAAVDRSIGETSYAALVLSLRLYDSEGLVNLSLVRSRRPELPVLVLGDCDAPQVAARVQALGARGYLSKRAPLDQIRSALSVVLQGGQWFPDAALTEGTPAVEIERLSPAQTRVMIELGRAQPNKLIAHNLNITEATVKSHLSAIYRTLGVSSRVQAMLALRQMGG